MHTCCLLLPVRTNYFHYACMLVWSLHVLPYSEEDFVNADYERVVSSFDRRYLGFNIPVLIFCLRSFVSFNVYSSSGAYFPRSRHDF
jgi:hypothetical protein